MDIKFSILVPVYNVEAYLESCIVSVINQTYENYELILVDDGSTDHSGEICDTFADKYEKIHVFHKENGGQISARLHAMENAGGDYYLFLDSDDTIKPNTLETIYKALEKYHCDCVVFGLERVKNSKVFETFTEDSEVLISDKRELYKKVFFETFYNSLARKAVKRDIIRNKDYTRYSHIRVGEDLIQSIEIYKNCDNIAFIPDILYEYRLNTNSATQTKNYNDYKLDVLEARCAALEFLAKENLFTEEDWASYCKHCLSRIIDLVNAVGVSGTSIKTKKRIYGEIYQHKYYTKLMACTQKKISLSGTKGILLTLFQKKMFGLIAMILSAKKCIKGK